MIFYRGLAIWQGLPIPEGLLDYLFFASCLFPIGIGWLFISNFNQGPRGKPTRYELENTFQKLRGKPRGIKPSGGIKKTSGTPSGL